MDASNQAAEQTLRMTLQSTEVALKITGVAAKHIATAIIATMSTKKRTKGRTRLITMLRSGSELKVYRVPANTDKKMLVKELRKYGVLYAAVKHTRDQGAPFDILTRAEDAAKLNRIYEYLGIPRVEVQEVAQVISEVEKDRAGRANQMDGQMSYENPNGKAPDETDIAQQDLDSADALIAEMLAAPIKPEQEKASDPFVKPEVKDPPSEPTSETKAPSEKATSKDRKGKDSEKKESVRKKIEESKERRATAKEDTKNVNAQNQVVVETKAEKVKQEKGR